jgi:hypothetical protein
MPLSHFQYLTDNFALRLDEPPSPERDPWYEVRELIDGFNNNTQTAGKFLCVDEIMSSWKGISSHFDALGIPHQSKIARKPEGVGAEMKAMACGDSGGIIMQLDIMEGKYAMAAK